MRENGIHFFQQLLNAEKEKEISTPIFCGKRNVYLTTEGDNQKEKGENPN